RRSGPEHGREYGNISRVNVGEQQYGSRKKRLSADSQSSMYIMERSARSGSGGKRRASQGRNATTHQAGNDLQRPFRGARPGSCHYGTRSDKDQDVPGQR